jgi:small-conductance mechanosensitive channel
MPIDLGIAIPLLDPWRREIGAALTLVVAFVVARLVDRAFVARTRRASRDTDTHEFSPVSATRVRLVRRLVFAIILVIGVALALSQFEVARRLATAVLASSAALGLIVGFAARQTIANAVAGISLAVTQPIRIGDLVTVEEETGVVEDMRLTYTYIRDDEGHRVIVPNERLAQTVIENHTIVDPRVSVTVSVWLPPGGDATRAVELLCQDELVAGGQAVDVTVGAVDAEGIRIDVSTWVRNASERGPTATRLRAASLDRLRSERLSSPLEGA